MNSAVVVVGTKVLSFPDPSSIIATWVGTTSVPVETASADGVWVTTAPDQTAVCREENGAGDIATW